MLDPLSMSSPENSASGSCPSLDSPLDRSGSSNIHLAFHKVFHFKMPAFHHKTLTSLKDDLHVFFSLHDFLVTIPNQGCPEHKVTQTITKTFQVNLMAVYFVCSFLHTWKSLLDWPLPSSVLTWLLLWIGVVNKLTWTVLNFSAWKERKQKNVHVVKLQLLLKKHVLQL